MPASRFSTVSVLIAVWVASTSIVEALVLPALSQPDPPVRGASSSRRSCGDHRRGCLLYGMTPRSNEPNRNINEDNDNDESPAFDAEEVRRQLDFLFSEGSDSDNNNNNNDKSNPRVSLEEILQAVRDNDSPVTLTEQGFPPPLLTATDRDRRQTEIRLLQELRHDDDANNDNDSVVVPLLWNLWYSERGGRARKRLEQADDGLNHPLQWDQSERILRELIAEHGPYFTEPLNRLATLYYLQGKLPQSYALCRIVLHSKPWHFGALSGIVLVAMARNDRAMARYWAARRLPSISSSGSDNSNKNSNTAYNPRRAEWVDWAVQEAQQALRQAEERTRRSLGKPEDYYKGETRRPTKEDDNVWQ